MSHITHFYNISFAEAMELPAWAVSGLMRQIPRIRAANQLELVETLQLGSGNMKDHEFKEKMQELLDRVNSNEGVKTFKLNELPKDALASMPKELQQTKSAWERYQDSKQ